MPLSSGIGAGESGSWHDRRLERRQELGQQRMVAHALRLADRAPDMHGHAPKCRTGQAVQ